MKVIPYKISAEERLLSQEAKDSGFGYGEWKNPKLFRNIKENEKSIKYTLKTDLALGNLAVFLLPSFKDTVTEV